MFRPPVNRAMRVLDRSFFRKTVPLAAAKVLDYREIANCRKCLAPDLLQVGRIPHVRFDPGGDPTVKLLLLKPQIKTDGNCLVTTLDPSADVLPDPSTWGGKLRDLVGQKTVALAPYDLDLDYSWWNYHDIISVILPEECQDEIPSSFSIVGHVAHVNLRDQFLPYKFLIAEVLIDKNSTIRTVVNKVDDVGTQSEYRTFQYELLAGDPSLNVETKEQSCIFRFDFSKVYWNPRLSTEHERLVDMFQPGQAVCDVMAGVGPFAIPAGKKKVFVWANDLNPDSYDSLVNVIALNKAHQFVQPFNEDGRDFIRGSAKQLLEQNVSVEVFLKGSKPSKRHSTMKETKLKPLRQPKTFDHYIMNLPATAITFLDAFVGLYHNQEKLFAPHTATKLPMIHVYCFSTKSDDIELEKIKICKEISKCIDYNITHHDKDVEIWDVRDVAPQKRIYCASFRLPGEVAFRDQPVM